MTIKTLDTIAHAIHNEMECDDNQWSAAVEITVSPADLEQIDLELHEATMPYTPFNHSPMVNVTIGDVDFRLRTKEEEEEQKHEETQHVE